MTPPNNTPPDTEASYQAQRVEAAALALTDILNGLMIMGMGGEQHAKIIRKGVIAFIPSAGLLLQLAKESLSAADAIPRPTQPDKIKCSMISDHISTPSSDGPIVDLTGYTKDSKGNFYKISQPDALTNPQQPEPLSAKILCTRIYSFLHDGYSEKATLEVEQRDAAIRAQAIDEAISCVHGFDYNSCITIISRIRALKTTGGTR